MRSRTYKFKIQLNAHYIIDKIKEETSSICLGSNNYILLAHALYHHVQTQISEQKPF